MKLLELKIPPLILLLLAAAAMWLVSSFVPAWRFDFDGRTLAAISLAVAGVCVTAAGVVSFRRAGTTVNPMKPDDASALVDTGIYRYTRNPMYLGFLLALLGWGVFLANPAALVVAPLFVLYMNRFQITPEERALGQMFGPTFQTYRRRVRRWL
ncbi:MAG: methyltransferase family protein [Steroidobacter sp.]